MMVEPMLHYTVALLSAAALAVFIITRAWPRRTAPGAKPLIAYQLCILLWTVPYAAHWLMTNATARFFWIDATYLGVVFFAVAFLAVALDYTGHGHWLTRRTLSALSVIPVITLVALFTDSAHGLFYGGHRTSGLIFSGGPAFWLNVIYDYSLMLFALGWLIRAFRHAPRLQRQQAGLILIGTLIPFIINLISLAGLSPFKDLDLTPFAFTLTGLFYAVSLFQFSLFDLVPIARSVLTEQLSDGVLVFDQHQRLVDLNPAAQHLLDRTEAQLIGQTLPQVLEHWPTNPVLPSARIELALFNGRIAEARLSPLTDRRGQQRGAVILLRDITDRQQAEAALRESEARFRSYFELPVIGIAITSPDKGWLDVNATLCEMLGYPRAELMHMTWATLTHPDDITADLVQFNRVLAGEIEGYRLEKRFIHKAGHSVHIDLAVQCLRRPDRSVDYFVALLQDITERKQAEVALRESERQYRRLIDLLPSGVIVHQAGQVLLANEAGARFFGAASAAQLIGTTLADRIHPDYRAAVGGRVQQATHTGVAVPLIDEQLLRLDGTAFDAEVAGMPMLYDGQTAMLAVFNDVTERKQAEAALRESERRFRDMMNQVQLCCAILDTQANITFANDYFLKMTGWSRDEVIGQNWFDRFIPAQAAVRQDLYRDLTAGTVPLHYENEILTRHGAHRLVAWSNSVVHDAAGGIAGIAGIGVDITERQQMEDSLRQSEERYRAIVTASPIGIASIAIGSLRIVSANPAFCQMVGYTEAELQHLTLRDITHPADSEAEIHDTRQHLANSPMFQFQKRYITKQQAVIWVNLATTYIRAANGQPLYGLGVAENITERLQAEQSLARRASQLAIINEIGRQITAARAVDDVLDLAAQLMCERLGVQHVGIFVLDDTHAELVLRSRAGDFAHLFAADHRLKIGQGIVGWVAEHGKRLLTNDVQTEARYVNVYGEALPTRSELAVPIIIAGTVRGVLDVQSPHLNAFDQNDVLAHETLADQIAVALENARLHEAAQREIIERTRAEEAWRESEAMLNATGQMAKVGGWELDAATQAVKWTAETYRIHGLPPSQTPPLADAIKFYHPEDRLQLEHAVQRALERGESFNLELRFIAATSQALWVQSTGHAQWQAGRVVKLFGTFQDITERKGFEETLLRLNAQLEQRVAERTAELQAANVRLTELDRLKDEFLARTSHELRTPLTGILISLELLEMSKPEKRERYMQRLKQSAVRLQAMIEDVLLFSQLNRQIDVATFGAIDLNNLIEGRLTTWQRLSIEHGLQIQLDLTHDLPLARVDGELVMQAITRLVANAVNYTQTGTVTVSTAVRPEAGQRWVTLSVADTGPGITPEDLPHIFERFYRGRAAADYKTPGTGVGLSISREIIERLGGRLTVETQIGVGSTFTLWLPAA